MEETVETDLSIRFNDLEKCYLHFNISLPIMGVLTEKSVYDILWNFPTHKML